MKNFTEEQLGHVLTFTTALADRMEEEATPNFAVMVTTDASLDAAEADARHYAKRRKAGSTVRSTFSDIDDKEVDEIRESIREYYRRTGKIVKG